MGIIRLFLALAVVIDHIAVFIFPGFDDTARSRLSLGVTGGYAVMMFFVVSGFLISYVLEEKYSFGGRLLAFYKARFLRIYPLWWAMLAIVAIGFHPAYYFSEPRIDIICSIILFGGDWRSAFVTYPEPYSFLPGQLGIGWSLVPEVTFYLIAPFILRSRWLSVVLFAASVGARLAVVSHYRYGPEWHSLAYYFFPTLLPFFLIGHFARLLWDRVLLPARIEPIFGLIFIPLTFYCTIQTIHGAFDSLWFYSAIVCFALSLPPTFKLTKDNAFMNKAGDLTYPLYLSHRSIVDLLLIGSIPLASLIRTKLSLMTDLTFEQFAIAAAVGCCALLPIAALVHLLIERPVVHLTRALVDRLAYTASGDKLGIAVVTRPDTPSKRIA